MPAAVPNATVRPLSRVWQTRVSSSSTAANRSWAPRLQFEAINDENPAPKAYRTAQTGFQTPIDEVDAAARILHPVFDGIVCETPLSGVFLKDYGETEW